MAKNLTFNDEMQKGLFKGIKKISDAVASTLGPAGRTVIIQEPYGNVSITKDGVSVAKSVSFEDPLENTGAQIINQIASKTNDVVGDGTTTSTVLARAFVEEGLKSVSTGVNPIDIKEGIDKAIKDTIKAIDTYAKPIDTKDQIVQIASISSNDDTIIGNEIATAIETVGRDGVITVSDSNTTQTYTDFVEGMQFDRGYLSAYFCNDFENMTANFENPKILLYDRSISNVNDIMPILEACAQRATPLLIVADDVEGEALKVLALNNVKQIIKVCAIKSPGFGDRKKDMLQDLAILTGATIPAAELGMELKDITFDMLGTCDSVSISQDSTTIVGGGGTEEAIDQRADQIRKDIENATSDYDKEKLQERLAKLDGGVAVINVGALTEAELKEKKHRVEDAINATRAAIQGGVIPGGGATLCKISKLLKETPIDAKDGVRIGYNIVANALDHPIRQIAENAGIDGAVIADKCKNADAEVGYDALNHVWGNMFDMGIMDPARVTKSALENAASIVKLILTSSCVITDIPEPKQNNGMSQM